MKKKRLIVFSVDAMVCEDIEELRKLPNFQKYLEHGCEVVNGMKTIYPSVTYPAHVSMITGCYPNKHGVISNFDFTTKNKDQNWKWFRNAYCVEDIFTAAKKKGYTTASFSWPVTGKHESIDWLMDEYWMPNPGNTLRSSFREAGSSEAMLDIIEKSACYLPEGYEKGGKLAFMQWPTVDDFIIHVACDVIKEHAPEVVFVHTGTFDSFRHSYGVFNRHIKEAVRNLDQYIGMLMDACRKAGVLEDTNLVLVSDHGQQDIKRTVNVNVLLADKGLIDVDDKGQVVDFKAFSFSNAMSALIYLKDRNDEQLKQCVFEYLKKLEAEGVYGIGKIYTTEEIEREESLSGDFSFVIESDGYTSFGDAAVRPLVQNFDARDYRFGHATHGYLPEQGPQPVFVAKGPDFKENFKIACGRVVDEAPTYARILGVTLADADGVTMEEIIR